MRQRLSAWDRAAALDETGPVFVRQVDRYGRVRLVPLGFALSPLEDQAFEDEAAPPCTSFTIH